MSEKKTYRYKLFRSNGSSDKYGLCEVCNKYVSDVFHQVEEAIYWDAVEKKYSWTQHECHSLFGHEECLIKQRR